MTSLTRSHRNPLATLLAGTVLVGVVGLAPFAVASSPPPLTIVVSPSGPFTRNFNPFTSGSFTNDFNVMYEPLLYYDYAGSTTKIIPWLASSYQWKAGNRTVVMRLRRRAKWSSGRPLTSADVVFTFDMLKKYPALDLNGDWSVLKSVQAVGAHDVSFTFKRVNVPFLYFVAGETPIVPAYIWSKVANPTTWTDPNPVGSGPYELASFNAELVTLRRNPSYWGPRPGPAQLDFPAYTSNTSVDLALSRGKVDWSATFFPNVQRNFVDRNPGHFFYPRFRSNNFMALYPNDVVAPTNSVTFRQALYYAINRAQVGRIGDSGAPPASPTSVLLPAPQYIVGKARTLTYPYDPAKAVALLESLGYKQVHGKMMTPSGKPLALSITVPSPFTNWVADAQVIQGDLKKIGIDVTLKLLSPSAVFNDQALGKFQLTLNGGTYGPTPWFQFYYDYSSATSAPLGKPAPYNFERYNNPQMNALIANYAATTNPVQQTRDIQKMALLSAERLPILPFDQMANGAEFTNLHYTGWPTVAHPYAQVGPTYYPDNMMVLLHLQPVVH